MNKEFISYEQALTLKELGFDEPCFFAFDNCSTPMRCSDLRTNEQKFYGVNYNSSSYTSQPTYSQAFRWFREKYDLSSWISGRTTMGFSYTIDASVGNFVYNTHEEAEQACLDKLIEIVRNGK